jgi:DNA repair exonuclease SbcCD ATPase subunit
MVMNSREFGHERFEELSALSAIGQISAEEFRELQAHLQTCGTCRLRQADFTEILHEHLPLLAPTDAAMPGSRNVAFHDASYKQRFIQRAQKEGLVFSPEVTGVRNLRPVEHSRWRDMVWLWQPKRLAFSLAVLALGFWLGSLGASRVSKIKVSPSPELASLRGENSRLRQQLEQLATQPPRVQSEAPVSQPQPMVPPASAQLERQLAQARQDSASAMARTQVLDQELQKTSAELASLKEEAGRLRSNSASSAKLKETEAALQAASSELQKLQRERSVYASTFADQQTQIRELMEKLGKQTEGIEQERELTAASRDIRQLMGARNLHIIDVEDVEDSRGAKQPVGRVFYTEGKSLIFYAFDLEKRRKSLEKYSFQAWGQREAKGGPVQSLGVFVNEDQGKSPWVLKYDDPKVLAQIDSVFVTIEPKGGSNRPQGRQLMYAYLRANANHP